jgi:hypothetical protein
LLTYRPSRRAYRLPRRANAAQQRARTAVTRKNRVDAPRQSHAVTWEALADTLLPFARGGLPKDREGWNDEEGYVTTKERLTALGGIVSGIVSRYKVLFLALGNTAPTLVFPMKRDKLM